MIIIFRRGGCRRIGARVPNSWQIWRSHRTWWRSKLRSCHKFPFCRISKQPQYGGDMLSNGQTNEGSLVQCWSVEQSNFDFLSWFLHSYMAAIWYMPAIWQHECNNGDCQCCLREWRGPHPRGEARIRKPKAPPLSFTLRIGNPVRHHVVAMDA